MSQTTRDLLLDFLQELADIAAFTQSGEAAFNSDLRTQKAVIRSYEVIGEICKRLPDTVRDQNPQIDWKTLMGFRDFLAHHYELIMLSYVWDAVEDVPSLRAAVEMMLASLPPEQD